MCQRKAGPACMISASKSASMGYLYPARNREAGQGLVSFKIIVMAMCIQVCIT
jgi:hypothetical protein